MSPYIQRIDGKIELVLSADEDYVQKIDGSIEPRRPKYFSESNFKKKDETKKKRSKEKE
jgi:hypothetical protein